MSGFLIKSFLNPLLGCTASAAITLVREVPRELEVERRALAIIEKGIQDSLQVENAARQLSEIELYNVTELKVVVNIILQKALNEPHYCKNYADMVLILRTTFPEFPPEKDGEKPHNFRRLLLTACQNEFESSLTTLALSEEELEKFNGPEEVVLGKKRRKDRLLTNMKLIGALFLRKLLSAKVVAHEVVGQLIGLESHQDGLPEEHKIESVVELLTSIGHTLDQRQDGKQFMNQCIARLKGLIEQMNGKTSVYPARIRLLVQGLCKLREDGWT